MGQTLLVARSAATPSSAPTASVRLLAAFDEDGARDAAARRAGARWRAARSRSTGSPRRQQWAVPVCLDAGLELRADTGALFPAGDVGPFTPVPAERRVPVIRPLLTPTIARARLRALLRASRSAYASRRAIRRRRSATRARSVNVGRSGQRHLRAARPRRCTGRSSRTPATDRRGLAILREACGGLSLQVAAVPGATSFDAAIGGAVHASPATTARGAAWPDHPVHRATRARCAPTRSARAAATRRCRHRRARGSRLRRVPAGAMRATSRTPRRVDRYVRGARSAERHAAMLEMALHDCRRRLPGRVLATSGAVPRPRRAGRRSPRSAAARPARSRARVAHRAASRWASPARASRRGSISGHDRAP